MMSHPLLATKDLTVRFGGHVAVDAVTCAFPAGELTAIVGPNGAGKTTYFNLISGQITPSSGSVKVAGEEISRMPVAKRTQKGIGRAFQLTNLFPNLSVFENIRLVIQAKFKKGFDLFSMADSYAQIGDAADEILQQVNLLDQRDTIVSALPHGDQRKLEVAMLIALDPLVYMFDEPTAGMSADEAPIVLELIAGLKQDKSKCVLLVEHKMGVIRTLADRIIVLHNGALVADGAPEEVMSSSVVQEAYMGKALGDA
ncbi:ABC transporter ATP-binding protein [Maritalea sp.]|jgi:branched-chain amino acid transport system ATP-binding protein|uniref:ABC transporter ATP-binding protein n=1 Tax=Maritalea sp. TaxID=2003361 RepID=UPI0039E506FF